MEVRFHTKCKSNLSSVHANNLPFLCTALHPFEDTIFIATGLFIEEYDRMSSAIVSRLQVPGSELGLPRNVERLLVSASAARKCLLIAILSDG